MNTKTIVLIVIIVVFCSLGVILYFRKTPQEKFEKEFVKRQIAFYPKNKAIKGKLDGGRKKRRVKH